MFYVGLDLGQSQDYTALAILAPVSVPSAQDRYGFATAYRTEYQCRHLERIRLGTTYPAIVERVKAIVASPEIQHAYQLVVDQTGVGRAVCDMIQAAGLNMTAVTITGGDAVTVTDGGYRVPKRDIVAVLQVLLQDKRLRFAEGLPEVPTLVNEMLAFKVKITESAHDTYGAWREGAHDDLVLSVGLATWWAERNSGYWLPM